MRNSNRIHNIVASLILAPVMRVLRNEYAVGVLGHMRLSDDEEKVIHTAEHSARQAMESVISGAAKDFRCPHCGSEDLDFDKGNGGCEVNDRDGVSYLYYTAQCRHCGKTVYSTYRHLGILTEEEFKDYYVQE